MVDYLVTNALVVTLDAERRIIRDGAVAIERDRILDVGKTDELVKRHRPVRKIDGKDRVVLPGFINGHTHVSAEQLVKGFVPDHIEVGSWLRDWTGKAYAAVTEEDEYYSCLHSFVECIKTGTTTICDGGTIHSLEAATRAMKKVGIRGVIGKWVWDIPDTPERMSQSTEEALRSNEEAVKQFDRTNNGMVRVWPMLIGDYPLFCTDELLIGSKRIADKYGVGLSLHQSSYPVQVEECIRRTGKRPMEHFEDLGILDKNLRLVHMIHVDDSEIKLLRKYDVKVVHCNTCALRLGYGTTRFGKFPDMMQQGICVGLGTDSPNASNHLDMGRAIYLVAGLYKDSRMDTNVIPAETALEMGTINGARTLLQENEIGSIERGKKADLILFDRRRPEWVPLFNVVNSLVYSADGKSVSTVLIDGKIVLENGTMTNLDEFEIYKKVQELGENLVSRTGLQLKARWKTI